MSGRVLILSGPTHEYLDPVRFLGNASSGRMGKALAEEALRRGWEVDFVSGPVCGSVLPPVGRGRIHHVTSAAEMLAAARPLFPLADIAVFAAAVADYAPERRVEQKMARSPGGLELRLHPTPDIARTLCAGKRAGQTAIGFALQTDGARAQARRKLEAKQLDGIVLNTPASLGAAQGTFSFLAAGSETFEEWGTIGKADCARAIFGAVARLRAARPG